MATGRNSHLVACGTSTEASVTRMLSRSQIQRIEAFRISRRLDIVTLKLTMGAPFTWATLLRALCGKPIQEASYRFLAGWLERFSPEKQLPDGKAAAAGEEMSL
jgi:hypothetical protein